MEGIITPYAKMIKEIVEMSNNHLTAEQVFFEMKQKMPKMSLATVYNNINWLVDNGYIRRLSIEGQVDRYDKILKHDHLICKSCGKIADVELKDLTKILKEQLGDEMISYDLRINYVCPDCRNKK